MTVRWSVRPEYGPAVSGCAEDLPSALPRIEEVVTEVRRLMRKPVTIEIRIE